MSNNDTEMSSKEMLALGILIAVVVIITAVVIITS